MSHFTLGHKGVEAVKNRKWEEGIRLLSDALNGAKSPAWLLARAQAYQQTSRLDQALADAERAYLAAADRQQPTSRDQMIMAQYRRAVILHKMGRFANSDACCLWSMQLAEGKNLRKEEDIVSSNVDENGFYKATIEDIKDVSQMPQPESGEAALAKAKTGVAEWTRAYVWRTQALSAMEKLPAGDVGRKLTVSRIPKEPEDHQGQEGDQLPLDDGQTQSRKASEVRAPPAKKPSEKLKVDYYQSSKSVNLTIFMAGADREKLRVDFETNSITLSNIVISEFTLPPTILALENAVNPTGCKYTVTPKKIEITLEKAEPVKWPVWGHQVATESAVLPTEQVNATTHAGPPVEQAAASAPKSISSGAALQSDKAEQENSSTAKQLVHGPAYPTSSKSGPKNWDKLAIDDDDDDNDVNRFFKQLYAKGTPEQQRAMMKSFTESNGTSLSTNWDDVKGRTIETQPPEGVEAKKW